MHRGYEMNCSPQSGRGNRPKLNEGLKKKVPCKNFQERRKKAHGQVLFHDCSVSGTDLTFFVVVVPWGKPILTILKLIVYLLCLAHFYLIS